MRMRIVTLSENTAGKAEVIGEYGLSVLLELDDRKILFDTGQSVSAVNNADALGVSLDDLEMIILSHGHYDHTGGLKEVLNRTGEIDIYAHPDIFQKKYAVRENKKKYIGIPFEKQELEELGARFKLTRSPQKLGNLLISGEIKRKTPFESVDPALYIDTHEGMLEPDPVLDDQAVGVKTPHGLFIILGCAHAGMINTIEQLIELSGESQVHTVIGGTHLAFASERQVDETVKHLKMLNIGRIGVSHCTGFRASMRLASAFGDQFFLNNAGDIIPLYP